jgi:hypothetical protein
MRRNVLLTAVTLFLAFVTQAQVTISSDITSNTTWTSNNIYTLSSGFIYVTNNAILTIEPGTIIKGNQGTLVITRGAKLIAEGTQTRPIVFTSAQPAGSRNPGDWGGIIVCGKAPINDPAGQRLAEGGIDPVKGLYGGTDANDNSGIIKYVRIEFAGIAYQPNNETNGLTLGAVGAGTTIDYVQVSHGGDDAFEWFGGTVNCKHLVANRTLDDMFDTDYGFGGRIQYAVGISDSLIADISGSNGFESDNDATGTTNGPLTKPIITNVSLFGPRSTATSTGYNANFKRGGHLRRSTSQCIYNSLIVGWPVGLKIEGTSTGQNATTGTLQFKNNIIAGCQQNLDSSALTTPVFTMNSWFNAGGNSFLSSPQGVMAVAPNNYSNPNFLLQSGSPALAGANFSYPNLNNAFFDVTTYRGAFNGTDDWTKCWTNWNAQSTPYTTPGISYLDVTATANGALTFCQGGSVVLTSSAASNNTWSNGTSNQSLTVTASGSYTVTTTNAAGCVATSAPITVVVNANPTTPTVTASGATTFCQGGSVTLTSSAASNNTWSGGELNASIVATTSGNYAVTVADNNGCQSTSTPITVTVNALPAAPTISANGPTSFCTGNSVVLTSNVPSGIQWSTTATSQSITVTNSGSYTVTVTDANNCSSTSVPTTVNVSNTPIPTISASATSACSGDTITLTASTADTYSWSSGQFTQSIDVVSNGTYTVTTTNSNACNGVGNSDPITVSFTQSPVANATYSTSGNVVTFTNSSTGGTSYSWDFGDFTNSSATSPVHAYAANGAYTAVLTATNGSCSDEYSIEIVISVSLEELSGLSDVVVYPNPTSSNANISFQNENAQQAVIQLFNQVGQLIEENTFLLDNGKNTLLVETSHLENGIYTISMNTENGKIIRKLILQK